MARIRTIKPEFWTDEKIISLPYVVRLFFIGLWNFCDDHGAFDDKPEQLRLLVLPNENRIDIYQIVDLLITSELIERHFDEQKDNTYLVIKNWLNHQRVDHPSKSKLLNSTAKKVSIPIMVRRCVAEKYNCKPGEESRGDCYLCNKPGKVYWHKKTDGSPSSWVTFTHEISHFVSENQGGSATSDNLVLACRNCNRSMGTKNALDWLFNGSYTTNQTSSVIETFRRNAEQFENSIEGSRAFALERKGKECKGKDISAPSSPAPRSEKKVLRKKTEEETEPFWQDLVKVWFDFNAEKFSGQPSFKQQDPKILKRIIGELKKRAEAKKVEWTQESSVARFSAFLEQCYLDPWLSKNFILSTIEKQFDKIILNHSANGTSTDRQSNATGQKPGTSSARIAALRNW